MVTAIKEDFKTLEETYQNLNIEEQIKNNRADLVLSDKNLEGITILWKKSASGLPANALTISRIFQGLAEYQSFFFTKVSFAIFKSLTLLLP